MTHAFLKLTTIGLVSLGIAASITTCLSPKAIAYSVCGIKQAIASYKTQRYLITICPGEASLVLILTYYDGTGYKRVAVQREGEKYRGTDGKQNYIIDSQELIISADYKEPIREAVLKSKAKLKGTKNHTTSSFSIP